MSETTGNVTGDVTAPGVGVQTLVLNSLPLLIASVPDTPAGVALADALREAGLKTMTKVVGAELPLGAKVGFRIEDGEVKLADLDGDVLLRAKKDGVDPDWVKAAVSLRGTMLLIVRGHVLSEELAGRELADTLDRLAGDGHVEGAVVGVEEERMRLPLLF